MRFVPVACIVGALADPAEGDHFGQLVFAEILEDGLQFFLDTVVDCVVEDGKRAFLLIVDIVGRFIAVIVGRRLGLILAAPEG